MQTNFFKSLFEISPNMEYRINVTNLGEDKLIVTVLPINAAVKDDAVRVIQPMVLQGTATELDLGFFDAICKPVEKVTELFANMSSFLTQLEEAKSQSRMEQGTLDKDKREKEQRKKKFEDQMKKVVELETSEKYGQAIAQMPKADQFPEQEQEITKKLDELRSKHGQLSLL